MDEQISSPAPKPTGVSRTRGSALLIAARLLGTVINLASVPLLMLLLGEPNYGAILFVLTLHGLLGLTDFGSVDVFQRQLSLAHHADNLSEERETRRDVMGIACLSAAAHILTGSLFGLVFSLTRYEVGFGQAFGMFFILGVQSALVRLNGTQMAFLAARHRFDAISYATAWANLLMTAVILGGIALLRQPWWYFVGLLAGEIWQMLYLDRKARQLDPGFRPWPAWRIGRIRPILKLCAVDFPNRVAAYFSVWGNKLVVGARVEEALVPYRNATRLPDSLRDVLQPLAATSLPQFTRDRQRSASAFQEKVLGSALTVLFAACTLLLVPAGFGDPLLRVWLGAMAPADGGLLMVQAGFYQVVQLYLAIMGAALFAGMKRQWFIPLTFLSAAVSVFLTLPAYRLGGLPGIGWLNVSLAGFQLVGIWFVIRELGFTWTGILEHIRRTLLVFAAALGFTLLGAAISEALPGLRALISLVLAPLFMAAFVASVVRLRIASLPDRLESRIPGGLRAVFVSKPKV